MAIGSSWQRFAIDIYQAEIRRAADGVIEITASDELAAAAAQGWAHAEDRGVQMELTRVVAAGRLCELIVDDDESFAIDSFMRSRGFNSDAQRDAKHFGDDEAEWLAAYGEGVDAWHRCHRRRWELRMLNHRPEPWLPTDCLAILRVMAYHGLAQSQEDGERLIHESLARGVDPEALRAIFSPHLEAIAPELIDALSKVDFVEPLLSSTGRWRAMVGGPSGSNAWAVAPQRSASGSAMLCGDPHLAINRLPSIWAEQRLWVGGHARAGITVPGMPGMIMGRTDHLAFCLTYGFMDMVDFSLERVRGGSLERHSGQEQPERRVEVVKRKKGQQAELVFFHTSRGQIEHDPLVGELEDGVYLARCDSWRDPRAASSFEVLRGLPIAKNVEEGQRLLQRVMLSANWILADSEGHIGSQQSGFLPIRPGSGLLPMRGWVGAECWQGLHHPSVLRSEIDPQCGVLVSANEPCNPDGGPLVTNLAMGCERRERILELLGTRAHHELSDLEAAQLDLTSDHSLRWIEVLDSSLGDSDVAMKLRGWDGNYRAQSREASAFEATIAHILESTVGAEIFGVEHWRSLVDETIILADFGHLFEGLLLEQRWEFSAALPGFYRASCAAVLDGKSLSDFQPWGDRGLTMLHLLFGGKLPKILGFDRGPFPFPGCRTTIVQGNRFKAHGLQTSVAPSWRLVTDLGTRELQTILAGGPSERRGSKLYTKDLQDWLSGRLKKASLDRDS